MRTPFIFVVAGALGLSLVSTAASPTVASATPITRHYPQGLTAGMAYFHNLGGGLDSGWTQGVPTWYWYNTSTRKIGAPYEGWVVVSDGDRGDGNAAGDGFYHQELQRALGTRPFSMTTIVDNDLSQAENYVLPAGTICGFHHTLNSPNHTCMGVDAASARAIPGWTVHNHFDMSSNTGHYVWYEYNDPHNLCESEQCINDTVRTLGVAFGVQSNTDASGQGHNCPAHMSRSAFYDAGRGSGQGLSFCNPY
jgi:hypothetical protein